MEYFNDGDPKAYISCPISVDYSHLQNVYDEVSEIGYDTEFWDRKERYNLQILKDCDVFVLLLPDNRFEIDFRHLPPGCQSELVEANTSNKEIFIGYKRNSDGKIAFYPFDEQAYNHITTVRGGIARTSNVLKATFNTMKEKARKITSDWEDLYQEAKSNQQIDLDRRVLLLG